MKKVKINFKDTLVKPLITFQFLVIISLIVLTSLLYIQLQNNLIPEVRVLSDSNSPVRFLSTDTLKITIDGISSSIDLSTLANGE